MTHEKQKEPAASALQRMAKDIFKEALENATDAIGMSTPEGHHTYQNKAFTDLFGVIGEDPPSTLYCDEKIGKEVFGAIMAGEEWTGEVEMYARDQRRLSILLRAYAIKDEQGMVLGLVGIHTDITEHKRVEEAIKHSEAAYREVFNSVNDTIWVHDVDTFEFIDVNNKVTEMFGYSVEQALKLSVKELSSGVPPFTLEEAAKRLEKARAGEPQIFDWHTRHKDGHLFWTEVSLKRGTIAGRACLLAIERDITERKQAEETLRQVHTLESLGTVAGGIAHDFNNLLMGVFGNMELAKVYLEPDHPALSSLQEAHKALENARHLTTRLLTFAKGGNPVLDLVDLRKCIRETVQFHLTGSKVATHFDIPADVWAARADRGQLVQVISNLTLNAKDAMPAGGTLHVQAQNISEIGAAAPPELRGDCVKLSIRDEGIGIPETILGRIFDPYFSTKQVGSGSGLGLAIVYSIISRHEGHISVESEPGAGTTFSVWLPADTTELNQPAIKKIPARDAPPFVSRSILLVDDERVVLETTSCMLALLGCTVETAINGSEGINKYATALKRGRPFDLAIIDLTIPGGMGGKEAIGELLALDPSAKVIVASGYSSDPVLADFSRYGFSERLEKPFTLNELTETLARVLKKK